MSRTIPGPPRRVDRLFCAGIKCSASLMQLFVKRAMHLERMCFSCVGCGKCCGSPPRLALSEIPHFIDTFAMQLEIYVQFGEAAAPNFRSYVSQKEQLHKLGGVSFQNAHGEGIARVVGEPLEVRKSRCPKLAQDGTCSIYERRPSICRVVPLDITRTEDSQNAALKSFQTRMLNNGFPCVINDSAPVIWENGKLAEGQYREAYFEAVSVNSEDALQKTFISSFLRYGEREFMTVIRDKLQGLRAHFPLALFLDCFPEFFPDPVGVAQTQLSLVQAGIADNLSRKSKEDRPNTEALRRAQDSWTKFLQR